MVFGAAPAVGQKVYALLDGTSDDTYVTQKVDCLINPSYYQPQTWHVERKPAAPSSYRLLVRGRSDSDCVLGQPESRGELGVNTERRWKVQRLNRCTVAEDTLDSNGVLIATYCQLQGSTISWRSGSACRGCCSCPDGALVDIDVLVSR
jgi:hypothetical protein